MWGYMIVILGIFVTVVMVVIRDYQSTNDQDYYLLKEVTAAAMLDSVDYGYYRDTGTLKMNTEKFVENFVRRFSETVNINKTYEINFYDIYEEPPAASVSVTTGTQGTNYGQDATVTENHDVTNRLTGILYTNTNYKP